MKKTPNQGDYSEMAKKSTKTIIPDSSLFGNDESDDEQVPKKTVKSAKPAKKSKKSKSTSEASGEDSGEDTGKVSKAVSKSASKESKKSTKESRKVAAATEFAGTIKEFIVEFIESQREGASKIKIADILEAWQSEENQARLIDMVKLRMPVPEPVKPRKAKDPNAPKRPRSAYIYYSGEKRLEMKAANPEMKTTEIAVELGKKWTALSERKKKPYLEKAAEDKKRYDAEMAEYKPTKPTGPKRPLTSYMLFSQEKRPEVKAANPDMKNTEIVKELGRMWKDDYPDPESRQKWIDLAEKAKERYTEEKAAWLEEHPEEKSVPKKKSKGAPKKSKGDSKGKASEIDSEEEEPKPKKRTKTVKPTGMVLFMQKSRPEIEEENPEWTTRQVIAEMKKRWSGLSAEERSEYD